MSRPVPRSRDPGTFFCGARTSPAVNVTLFQASAAKRAPTMAGPSVAQGVTPKKGRGSERGALPPRREDRDHEDTGEDEPLRHRERVLDGLARPQTPPVGPREPHEQRDRGEPLRRRPELGRAEERRVPERRPEHAEEARERDGDRGDRPRLDDEELGPPEEERGPRPERLSQINVLAARLREHRGELPVRERGGHGQRAGERPHGEEPAGRPRLAARCRPRRGRSPSRSSSPRRWWSRRRARASRPSPRGRLSRHRRRGSRRASPPHRRGPARCGCGRT